VSGTTGDRVRYRAVLANREYAALYSAQCLSLLGDQLARIAIAILVYRRTGSPLAASSTYAVSYLAYLVGGPLLAGLADRFPRLTVMVACDLARAPLVLLLCVEQPLWLVFTLVGLLGALAPPFDSARGALQPDVLQGEAYVTGNALINVSMQVSQVAGFVLGGTVVALTSVRGAIALDAATFVVSAGILLAGVRHRPAALDRSESRGFFRDAMDGLRLVARTPVLRRLLLLSVLASVAVTAPEGLAVPVARDLGGGALAAGILTATVPAGFLLASVVVLRLDPERRLALLPALVVLAGAPLLLTPLVDTLVLTSLLWVVAGFGATVNLVAGPAFMQRCPPEVRGRAYGFAATALYAGQGIALVAAGLVADALEPDVAVAVMAAGTLAVTLLLLRGAQGMTAFVRSPDQ
jgi:MFS family permease